MAKSYGSWPLLRLFADGSDPGPIIAPGQKLRSRKPRELRHRYLKDSRVKVLETGFVGRRRQIQAGIKVLRGDSDKHGLLITGTAGLGKSCLAGRLIEHGSDREPFAFHGELTATELVPKLRSRFEELGIQQGLDILDQNEELEDKLKSLCREVFKTHPFLLLLDDFEQNLEMRNSQFCVKDQFLPVVRGLLSGLPWCNNMSALIITCRYPFVLDHSGSDLVQKHLENIPLMSFRDADLDKKVRELSHISASSHSRLYLNAGKGNPRLLEWLDAIAAEEKLYDLHDLERKIAGQTDDFVRAFLANLIASAHGNDFHTFLSRASVFRCPVPETAFAMIGTPDLLHLGVRLTLCEKEDDNAGNILYWVNPVIREDQWNRLDEQEQRRMHEAAFGWYDKECRSKKGENKNPQFLEQAVFHGLACDKVIESCDHAIWLGDYFEKVVLYIEKKRVLQCVADRITEEVKAKTIEGKEGDVGIVLNNLGSVFADLGDNRKAIEYFTRALEIDLDVFGDKHPKIAIRYNNLGLAWKTLGDIKKGIAYYTRALEIDLAVFGDKHPNVAVANNNLGAAWRELGDANKAIAYYTRALEIDLAVFGDKHPDTAIDYNNLGAAWRELGDANKAIAYYTRALEIDLAVFGDKHPNVARNYNNLGEAWRALGYAKKAIEYYMRALEILISVYGEKHPNVASSYNNLGSAWADLGDKQNAIEYYTRALEILANIYGEKHPNVAVANNNLGTAWRELGDANKAIDYYMRALEIDLAVFSDKHPKVAIRYNNLGLAWDDLGDKPKARDYYTRALTILEAVYGPDHPHTLLVRKNLKLLG